MDHWKERDKIDASLTKTRHLKASGSHLDGEDVRFNLLTWFYFIRKVGLHTYIYSS